MRRICVIGTTGSGKSTLAATIGGRLGIPVVELDALHWEANWTEAEPLVLRRRVGAATAGDRWVADGNYSSVRDLTWDRADTMIWLDYPFWIVARRLVGRTLRRGVRREVLWNGNRERLWVQFLTRDSLLLWFVRTWGRRRRDYPRLLAAYAARGVEVRRLRHPVEADRLVRELPSG